MPLPYSSHSQPNWSKNVRFHPWVGARYTAGRGPFDKKLLLIGESHYGEAHDQHNTVLTQACIQEHAARAWKHRFFTSIAIMVEGRPKEEIDLLAFWHSVAFYNFSPTLLVGPRIPPDWQDIEAGRPIFQEVLDRLEPDCVVVLSGRLFDDWLPEPLGRDPFPVGDHHNYGARFYASSAGHPVLLTWTYHPSSPHFGGALANHAVIQTLLAASPHKPAAQKRE